MENTIIHQWWCKYRFFTLYHRLRQPIIVVRYNINPSGRWWPFFLTLALLCSFDWMLNKKSTMSRSRFEEEYQKDFIHPLVSQSLSTGDVDELTQDGERCLRPGLHWVKSQCYDYCSSILSDLLSDVADTLSSSSHFSLWAIYLQHFLPLCERVCDLIRTFTLSTIYCSGLQ